jgi:hypothetical protein
MTFPCEKSFEPIVTAEQLIQKTMRPVRGTVLAEVKCCW